MTRLEWCGKSHQIISNSLRRWCVRQVKVTDAVTTPESPEGKPLEPGSSSLSEAPITEVKEESTETPVEKTEVEPRSDEAEEKTEVEPGDDVEEKTANTDQIDVKDPDQDEDKVTDVWMI